MRAFIVCFLAALVATCWSADKPRRITCIGDSITAGYGLSDPATAYPAVLQGLLTGTAEVTNAGSSGSTALASGDRPYRTCDQYALAIGSTPAVVVVMLGANDSKPWNWDAHKGDFARDLADLVDLFAELPSKPEVWLCTPPPAARGNFAIRCEVIETEIVPAVMTVAKAKGLRVIDVFSACAQHPEFFPDGVHPDVDGAALIARTVAAALSTRKTSR